MVVLPFAVEPSKSRWPGEQEQEEYRKRCLEGKTRWRGLRETLQPASRPSRYGPRREPITIKSTRIPPSLTRQSPAQNLYGRHAYSSATASGKYDCRRTSRRRGRLARILPVIAVLIFRAPAMAGARPTGRDERPPLACSLSISLLGSRDVDRRGILDRQHGEQCDGGKADHVKRNRPGVSRPTQQGGGDDRRKPATDSG
jgi:hypothetical protein